MSRTLHYLKLPTNLLLILVFSFSLLSCGTVDRFLGETLGVPAVDTPVKRWAVAQDSLTTVTNVGAKLIEDQKLPLNVAQKFSVVQKEVQRTLDQVFDAITSSEQKTQDGLDWNDALGIAVTKIASLQQLIEVFN